MKDTFRVFASASMTKRRFSRAPAIALILGLILVFDLFATVAQAQEPAPRAVVVVHGGAGSIRPERIPLERRQEYSQALEQALLAGYTTIQSGGTSPDAVEATIRVLEDSPLFNAGLGAVLNSDGIAELDASIMDGSSHRAGAVAAVRHIPNPVSLARAVMDRTNYVLLSGRGAEMFAAEIGMDTVSVEYFRTDERLRQYNEDKDRRSEPTGGTGERGAEWSGELRGIGTVGAVARDRNGNLAAATSTGGISYKQWSRIGDSPIIGAGTYADNETAAVSATGTGEYFIRGALAFRVTALMRYAGLPLAEAAASVIHGTLASMGGDGGMISIDQAGNIAMPFNTDGMFRGYVDEQGKTYVAMFGDE